ncbi:hypothetical protein ABE137_12110 [Brevibacillus laterosporus]|uniref:DUF7352 domain-containing protein n=1 Tax=Brevibacillus laterosporus TaxID=1465 RepID=UPI0006BC7263|nr:hypothetical protein AVT09_gp091 [Brevibacillus phage Sundance]ALA47907.1 hypothetical protein SUNDANCE_91 [Brevibacillus phage Sundance]
MKKIFKYPFESNEIIYLPVGAKILSIKLQRGKPVIYAIVNTLVKGIEPYEFIAVCTGEDADKIEDYKFIGTLMFGNNQTYVEHIFYRKVDVVI